MANPDQTHAYYSARAPQMAQRLHAEPTPQLREIVAALKACALNRSVLEVACGTGYWTRHIGPVSSRTVATDFSNEMVAITRGQEIPHTRVLHDDAYRLDQVGEEPFEVGFAMHWVSHIPMARWAEFFRALHARLKPGATVLLADDIYRPGDTDPYYSKLDTRDSYEIRILPNGSSYEIVKTYFSPERLRELLQPFAEDLEIHFERPRWWLTYRVKSLE